MPGKPNESDVQRMLEQLQPYTPEALLLERRGSMWKLGTTRSDIFHGLPVGWAYIVMLALVRWERMRAR